MADRTIFLALGTDLETDEDLTCVLRLDRREVEFLLGRFAAFRNFAAAAPYLAEACWDDDLPEWKRGKLATPAGSGLALGPEGYAECQSALLDMARRGELEDVDLIVTRGDDEVRDALEVYWAGIDPDTEEAVTTACIPEDYLRGLLDRF